MQNACAYANIPLSFSFGKEIIIGGDLISHNKLRPTVGDKDGAFVLRRVERVDGGVAVSRLSAHAESEKEAYRYMPGKEQLRFYISAGAPAAVFSIEMKFPCEGIKIKPPAALMAAF